MIVLAFLPDNVSIYFCNIYAIYEEKITSQKSKNITTKFLCKLSYTKREHDYLDKYLHSRDKKAVRFKLELIKQIGEINKY
jgi:hypothetical protein